MLWNRITELYVLATEISCIMHKCVACNVIFTICVVTQDWIL